MRRRVIVEGAFKSVASTGYQTTNTRRCESVCFSNNDSNAEAPANRPLKSVKEAQHAHTCLAVVEVILEFTQVRRI
jgi:hypothetical protein